MIVIIIAAGGSGVGPGNNVSFLISESASHSFTKLWNTYTPKY